MIKNQVLERRIAQLVAQTYAITVEKVLEEINLYGIEVAIQKIEEIDQNSPNFN